MEHQTNIVQTPVTETRAKKRRRPALACLPCHRRKLKCGREFPACERCRRRGHPHDCIYREVALRTSVAIEKLPGLTEVMGRSTDTATEDGVPTYSRTTETETTTATSLQSLKPSSHTQDEEAEKIQTEEVTIYKGEDLLTRFYGHTYHRNFYQQVSLPC